MPGILTTPFSVANTAILKAQKALTNVGCPYPADFQYTGFRSAQYSTKGDLTTAFANVLVAIRTPIDFKLRIEMPVPVRGDKIFDPQIFFHAGRKYPLNKDAVKSLLFGGSTTAEKVMNMYNAPRIIKFPAFAQGLFSTDLIPNRNYGSYPGSINWAMS